MENYVKPALRRRSNINERAEGPFDARGVIASTAADTRDAALVELKQLTLSLMEAVRGVNEQVARNGALQNAVGDIGADLKAAARAMLLAPATSVAAPIPSPQPSRDSKCAPCDCVHGECCSFEVVLAKVRAAKPQVEPPDSGDIPLLINAMEVQIYVTAGDFGILLPGLGTTMDLRASGLPPGPGPWVTIERVVNRISVRKGVSTSVQLCAEIREHDEGVERPISFKDELGEATGSITLDCCMSKVYPPLPLDVPLVHGGEGGGMVQLAFYARRVCC